MPCPVYAVNPPAYDNVAKRNSSKHQITVNFLTKKRYPRRYVRSNSDSYLNIRRLEKLNRVAGITQSFKEIDSGMHFRRNCLRPSTRKKVAYPGAKRKSV